jgi:UPF0042 nucleotide-binding protein
VGHTAEERPSDAQSGAQKTPVPNGGAATEGCAHASGGPDVLVVTGMSGAGRTEALHILEDMGYYCIDNIPPTMIKTIAELVGFPAKADRRIAVVCDVRSGSLFSQMRSELHALDALEVSYQVLFLDAEDEVLRTRYSALRRRHPLMDEEGTVTAAIARERARLSSIKELANVVVDTTRLHPRQLRELLNREFSTKPAREGMNVSVFSFGFKYGMPLDADLVIDVRFLPNPYYDPALRPYTGLDAPVRDFVVEKPETKTFLAAWFNLLDVVMPGYVAEGKQHLSVAVGCTGGQHRSVALAQATAEHLEEEGYRVSVSHRDIAKNALPGGAS